MQQAPGLSYVCALMGLTAIAVIIVVNGADLSALSLADPGATASARATFAAAADTRAPPSQHQEQGVPPSVVLAGGEDTGR